MENKTIVLTTYGKNETVESISISLFDKTSSYNINKDSNAINYCENINSLELKENNWIYASIINENEKIVLKPPSVFDTNFDINNFEIINGLDDRCLQKILREVSMPNLAVALKNVNEETKEKVFKNMSKRASVMLKEDIEILNHVSDKDITDPAILILT